MVSGWPAALVAPASWKPSNRRARWPSPSRSIAADGTRYIDSTGWLRSTKRGLLGEPSICHSAHRLAETAPAEQAPADSDAETDSSVGPPGPALITRTTGASAPSPSNQARAAARVGADVDVD